MSSRPVMRITSHLTTAGTMRYYAAYTKFAMKKATVMNVPPDAFLDCYVTLPTREYPWIVKVWTPRPSDANKDVRILSGVTMQRWWWGPMQPGTLLSTEEALRFWRQYTHLMWAQR